MTGDIEDALASEVAAIEQRRREAEAAALAAEPAPMIRLAASMLGVPADEVVSVVRHADGIVITAKPATEYVVVPEDSPDAEGKVGLMLYRAPNPGPVNRKHGFTRWREMPLFVARSAAGVNQ